MKRADNRVFTQYTAVVFPKQGDDPLSFVFVCGEGTVTPGPRILMSSAWSFPPESYRAIMGDSVRKSVWARHKPLVMCAVRDLNGGQPSPGGRTVIKRALQTWVQVTTQDVPYATTGPEK